jgi:ankyrin repeat protein
MIENLESIYDEMCNIGFSTIQERCKKDASFIFGCDETGNTMLHYAAYDGNTNAIEYLLGLGSCPLLINNVGMTPLSNAAGCENVEALKLLINKSLSGLLVDDQNMLLAIAASRGRYENLEYMLNAGFKSDAVYRGDPILYWAMQSSNLEIVRLLCENGSDVNAVNSEGKAPIFDAAGFGLIHILKYLLSKGAYVDIPADDGTTPLIIASCYNQIDIVRVLISKECNIEAKTNDGITALLYAVGHGYIELVKLLLKNGADKCVVDNKKRDITKYFNQIKNKQLRDRMKAILHIT